MRRYQGEEDYWRIRATGDVADLPARSWASWRAFHPEAPDEDYEGWERGPWLAHWPISK